MSTFEEQFAFKEKAVTNPEIKEVYEIGYRKGIEDYKAKVLTIIKEWIKNDDYIDALIDRLGLDG